MRRILICTGVLGGGTALVFAAAALTAVLIPPGRIVPQTQSVTFGMIRSDIQPNVIVDQGFANDIVVPPAPEETR